MKSFVLVTVAATALLGACASTSSTVPLNAAASPADTTNAYGREVDQRRVNAINNVARVNGVEVHWINYPEAKPASRSPVAAPVPTGT